MKIKKLNIQLTLLIFTLMATSVSDASSYIYRFETSDDDYMELLVDYSPGYLPPGFSDDGTYEIVDSFEDFYEVYSSFSGGHPLFFFSIELLDTNIDDPCVDATPDIPCTPNSGPGFGSTAVVASDPGLGTGLNVPGILTFRTGFTPVEEMFFPTSWEPGVVVSDFYELYTMELVSVRAVPLPASLPLLGTALFSFFVACRNRSKQHMLVG